MILSVCAQKGGTGKTTTAGALVNACTKAGKSTLAIDLDAQGSLTNILQGDATAPGAFEILQGADIKNTIQQTPICDIVPAGFNLNTSEAVFNGKKDRDFYLKTALEPIISRYDVIIIDNPPNLSTLLINSLTASDSVIIPLRADAHAIPMLYQLSETISQVQAITNPGLSVAGVALCQYSDRTILQRDLKEAIGGECKKLGYPLLKTTISPAVAIMEANLMRANVFDYAPKCKPAREYLALSAEIGLLSKRDIKKI